MPAAFALTLFVIAFLVASTAQGTTAHFQVATPQGDNVTMSAGRIYNVIKKVDPQYPETARPAGPAQVVYLRGNVEIRTKDVLMTADEADYTTDTSDIALRGQVHVKLARQN